MRADQKAELERIKEMAIDHAIEEMDASHGLSLDTMESRGDRRWLTQMASSSIKVAAQIENFLMHRERPGALNEDQQRKDQQAAEAAIRAAAEKVRDIKSGKKKSA